MMGWIGRFLSARANKPQHAPAEGVDVNSQDAEYACEEQIAAGEALLRASRIDEALERFADAIEIKHDSARAHCLHGMALLEQGELEEAAHSFSMALVFDSAMAQAHHGMALVEGRQGNLDEALSASEKALQHGPPTAELLNQRGAWLGKKNDIAGAVRCFERAVELDERFALAHNNLGYLLHHNCGEYDRGAQHIERAAELAPADRAVQCNVSMLLLHRGQNEAAIALCDWLLKAAPDMHEARLNRGLARLLLGDFGPGWDDYEARKLVSSFAPPVAVDDWQEQSLAGRTVLVRGEQGLGDEILFASCLSELMAQSGRCVIACAPRLRRLFQRSFPRATVMDREGAAAALTCGDIRPDFQVWSGSLPRRLRRQESDFPDHRGYLEADAEATARWRRRLAALGSGLKVGVSWKGGTLATGGPLRSMRLETLVPLLQTAGCRFVDLQYGDTAEERAVLAQQTECVLHRWPEAIDDFDECAALVSALDVVVSVCTTLVDLAGALGRPLWVMVPSKPEWRFMQEGTGMPWYPSARLLRQERSNDWTGVLVQVRRELASLAQAASC